MEQDKRGMITRFDRGDQIIFQGMQIELGPTAADVLNMNLGILKDARPDEIAQLRTFKMSLRDNNFERTELGGTVTAKVIDVFLALPVDLSTLDK